MSAQYLAALNGRPTTSRLGVRNAFVHAMVEAGVHAEDTAYVQDVIDAAVNAAAEVSCCPLEDHWREGDTDELRVGHGDDVGECELGCPVADLAESGLICVPVLLKCKTCTGYREHYGDCPGDEGDVPERLGDTRDTL